jgi:prepilin-type processing-associated H-X9-DG protein
MGTPTFRYGTFPLPVGPSCLVALLPDLEASPLSNAVNFEVSIYTKPNGTVRTSAPGVLLCPSDPSVQRPLVYPEDYFDSPRGTFVVTFSSYAACAGTWYHHTADAKLLRRLVAQDNGVAFANSSVRFSGITDGLGTTLLFGERPHGRIGWERAQVWHWWFDGYFGDTLFWTLHPLNAWRLPARPGPASDETHPHVSSAGSLHPGGALFAFADGSVRFLSDDIDSWRYDPARGMPVGVEGGPTRPYTLARDVRPGVYQRLSTRAGGEPVGADAFPPPSP